MAEVETKIVEAQTVASLSFTGPYDQTEDMMDELMGWLMRAGHPYSAPPFAIYYDDPDEVPDEELRAEVCLPLEERVRGDEEVDIKDAPSALMACATHEGPYEDIPDTYEKIFAWIEDNGRTFQEEMGTREVFLKQHGEVETEEELLTEVQVPIVPEGEETEEETEED
jgi:AraC family transcriptional regulator